MRSSLQSLCLLILLGCIWGTGYSIARFAVTHGVSALGYSFWQSLGPALLLGLATLLPKNVTQRNHGSQLLSPGVQGSKQISIKFYMICGLTGIAIPNSIMYFAASHLPASILAIVVNIVPIIAYPLALAYRLENFNKWRFTGICFAFVGLMLIILPKSSLPSHDMVPWVLISLITPFSFAICSNYIARIKPGQSSLTLSAGMLMTSSLLLIPLVLLTNSFYFFHLPLTDADWVILLEILLSTLGYVLFFKLIKFAGPVYYSLVDTIVVLTGIFWGVFLFQEYLNLWTYLAVIAILLGLLLVTQQQRKHHNEPLTYGDVSLTN